MVNSIILRVNGGLGNQMFQIANAYHLSKVYDRKLYICKENTTSRTTYWDSIFLKFSENLISHEEYNERKSSSKIYNWAMYRFEYKEINLDSSVECYCIEGYYQSFKYFDIDDFRNMLLLQDFDKVKYNIRHNDVALHIRRGDYLKKNFHKVLSKNYYENCIHNQNKRCTIGNIYVFSDDIKWCKENLSFNNIIYVTESNEITEFSILTSFSNIIIANSSFSWWAAYLGKHTNVFCPQNWFEKGCTLNTRDLRPSFWNTCDDEVLISELKLSKYNPSVFNVVSLGSACCMVQNIHDNIYHNLGPLFRQPANAANFFDWLIVDFRTVVTVFKHLKSLDSSFLTKDNFTFENRVADEVQLHGGWKSVYRKTEHKELTMISLHDVKKENESIPMDFIEKYKRRFERLHAKLKENNTVHLMHCIDFQWLSKYIPTEKDVINMLGYCKEIKGDDNTHLHIFVHPKYHSECKEEFSKWQHNGNVHICYLEDKGFHADWKANNLTFDSFLHI